MFGDGRVWRLRSPAELVALGDFGGRPWPAGPTLAMEVPGGIVRLSPEHALELAAIATENGREFAPRVRRVLLERLDLAVRRELEGAPRLPRTHRRLCTFPGWRRAALEVLGRLPPGKLAAVAWASAVGVQAGRFPAFDGSEAGVRRLASMLTSFVAAHDEASL